MIEYNCYSKTLLTHRVVNKKPLYLLCKSCGCTKIKVNSMLLNENHKKERFRFYSINELKDLPKISWLIEGLLPSSGIGAIYGASGSTKSFLALDLALHIASQEQWFGYEIKKNIPVYFIGLEGEAGIPRRISAWLKRYELDYE